MDARLNDLPPDRTSLQAMLRSLLVERDEQKQRAEQQTRRADELYLQNLRLQLELERYKLVVRHSGFGRSAKERVTPA